MKQKASLKASKCQMIEFAPNQYKQVAPLGRWTQLTCAPVAGVMCQFRSSYESDLEW